MAPVHQYNPELEVALGRRWTTALKSASDLVVGAGMSVMQRLAKEDPWGGAPKTLLPRNSNRHCSAWYTSDIEGRLVCSGPGP
jgi:hypothetical protein